MITRYSTFSDDKGKTYVAYIMTNSSNESTLMIRSLVDNKTNLQIALGFNVTSTPFVMVDYKKHNAPKRKTLYIGDDKGKIYSASLLKSNGKLRSKAAIKTALKSGAIASLDSSNTDSIRFIGSSVSSTDRAYYLRAQSETRLSVFKYDTQKTKWNRVWSSFEGGSGQWQADGTFTNSPSSIQHLPKGATITDNAYIVGDSIVLPVNTPDPTGTVCYGMAYYYLYKLSDGSFPKTRFYKLDDSAISGNIKIGYGKATRLVLSDLPDKDVLVGYAHAEQTTAKSTGVNDTFLIRDTMTTGVRSWRILDGL
ncbi:MAG TPA: hypothetical protein EYG71_07095 [Leucothrix sp.]|nr:hypothetical protein [Leucothrix sp.]